MLPVDWNAAIDVMRGALSPALFKSWVEPLCVIHCDDDKIVLGAPNKFHEDYVRKNYSIHIANALEHTSGRQLCLEFEVTSENLQAASVEISEVDIPEVFVPGVSDVSDVSHLSRPHLRVVLPSSKPTILPPNIPQSKHPFYELESNRYAYQCANHLINGDRSALNPYVVEATTGMGKTHLLSHIAHGMFKRNPHLRIQSTNTEAFTSEIFQSYTNKTNMDFRRKYCLETDVFILDDLQMISKKSRTQEELLYIFKEISARGGLLIFATSAPISKLEEIIDPLRSRILAGVTAEIRSPTFDDRTRLLAQIAVHEEFPLDDLTLKNISDRGQKDNRELISTLYRLHLRAQIGNKVLDSNFLSEVGFHIEGKRESVTIGEIVALVEHSFGVSQSELVSKSRKGSLNWARQVAMYLARCYTHHSMEFIGQTFGRDHSTVVHAYQRVSEAMETQPTRRYEVQHLKQKLQSRAPKNHVPF